MTSIIFFVLAGLSFTFFIWFAIVSIFENENLATKRSVVLAILSPIPFIFFGFLPTLIGWIILVILSSILIITTIVFFFPIKKIIYENEIPHHQIDERDTMFSRLEITRYPDRTKDYYLQNPKNLKKDKKWHNKPGLMGQKSTMYSTMHFAAAEASFDVIGELRSCVSPNISDKKQNLSSEDITQFIKTWGKKLGALDIGICELKPYHFYSHRGRGDVYGKEVLNKHKYAIALTVEMDKDYLATGPSAPTVIESAQQYLNSGAIALQLTYFIANIGYSAKAHIDGNYEVVCPLVARDAGMGEIGRMGLLMTPNLGPRVRIAVITTDVPVITNERNYNGSVHDFCQICKKCADVCPSQAIPKDPKKEISGIKRWQINQEKCFNYWCTVGTDCGRCMSVCPYSHPDNSLHNMVRWGIKKSWFFRRIALWMDDFFYGRKPKVKKTLL